MMMARDSTPHPELSAESLDALRAALRGSLDGAGESPHLRPALRRVAEEARERHLRPEQLLIVLKDVWFALPEVGRAPQSDSRSQLLQRVISVCIREYYAE